MKKIVVFALACLALGSFASAQDGPTACTMEYAPVCGQPPMPPCPAGMACAQVMPQPVTYGNTCMMNAAAATLLYTGECDTGVIVGGDRDEHGCIGSAGYSRDTVSQQCVRPREKPTACTKEYMPVCGEIQIQCFTTPCNPIHETYGNVCEMKNAGADLLYKGACADVDLKTCSSYFDGCNTCSVKDGELDACTLMYCESPQAPRCLQYVSEVSFGDYVALSSDGMQTIKTLVTRILAPWTTLVTKSQLYVSLLEAIDGKIQAIQYQMTISRYTAEGYQKVVHQLAILQYVEFLLRNLQAAL